MREGVEENLSYGVKVKNEDWKDEFLNQKQFAARLGVDRNTVLNWMKKHSDFPRFVHGTIRWSIYMAWREKKEAGK